MHVTAAQFDLILRGGRMADGTGAPLRRADVGIDGDRIIALGDLRDVSGRVEIGARERIVAADFFAVHSRDDTALLAVPYMTPKLSQGVTTVVTGNSGFSMAPLTPRTALPQEFRLLVEDADFRFCGEIGKTSPGIALKFWRLFCLSQAVRPDSRV